MDDDKQVDLLTEINTKMLELNNEYRQLSNESNEIRSEIDQLEYRIQRNYMDIVLNSYDLLVLQTFPNDIGVGLDYEIWKDHSCDYFSKIDTQHCWMLFEEIETKLQTLLQQERQRQEIWNCPLPQRLQWIQDCWQRFRSVNIERRSA